MLLDLGVILFTGLLYKDIPSSLIQNVDIIVDGGFEKDNLDNERNLIGSRNQEIYFVSERYKSCPDWFYIKRPKRVEINLSGDIVFNGDVVIS
jgi:anaerobic ribonucleoside-triphosphate reductase activating protein